MLTDYSPSNVYLHCNVVAVVLVLELDFKSQVIKATSDPTKPIFRHRHNIIGSQVNTIIRSAVK